jgi:hypothetical protein
MCYVQTRRVCFASKTRYIAIETVLETPSLHIWVAGRQVD